MGKIGFFGGCFNPPTNIHINIANKLLKEKKVDEIIFVPVNDYYNKNELVEAKHRINMLKLAIKGFSKIGIDDIEIKENKRLYAVDVFKIIDNKFAKKINKENIFFIMGSDNYEKMPKWKSYNAIKDEYNYIIINRDKKDISSTTIRGMIKTKNKKVKKYLPKEVYKYIVGNKLYE